MTIQLLQLVQALNILIDDILLMFTKDDEELITEKLETLEKSIEELKQLMIEEK